MLCHAQVVATPVPVFLRSPRSHSMNITVQNRLGSQHQHFRRSARKKTQHTEGNTENTRKHLSTAIHLNTTLTQGMCVVAF